MTARSLQTPPDRNLVQGDADLGAIVLALAQGVDGSRRILASAERAILNNGELQLIVASWPQPEMPVNGSATLSGLQDIDRVMQRLADLHHLLELLAVAASGTVSPVSLRELVDAARLAEIRALLDAGHGYSSPAHSEPILF